MYLLLSNAPFLSHISHHINTHIYITRGRLKKQKKPNKKSEYLGDKHLWETQWRSQPLPRTPQVSCLFLLLKNIQLTQHMNNKTQHMHRHRDTLWNSVLAIHGGVVVENEKKRRCFEEQQEKDEKRFKLWERRGVQLPLMIFGTRACPKINK